MKKTKLFGMISLTVIPFVLTSFVFAILPDKSVIHIPFLSNVMYVTKGSIFILPILLLIYVFIHVSLFFMKKKSTIIPLYYAPISIRLFLTLIEFNIIIGGLLYVTYYLSTVSTNVYILFPILSLVIIFISILSIAFKRNSLIGIRTPWSGYNEEVWNKTQKASAYITLLIGSIVAFATLTIKNYSIASAIFIGLFLLDAALCIVSSFYYYKKSVFLDEHNGKEKK